MLPLTYVLRNLGRRRLRTGLTMVGIALVVAVYFLMASVAHTLVRSFRTTGTPEEVVIVQAGAMTVDYSSVDRGSLTWVQTLRGVASAKGQPLVSPELALGTVLDLGGREQKASLRGVTAAAPGVYRQVRLAAGEWPGPGRRVAAGRSLVAKLGLELGDELDIERDRWRLVGILDSGGRVYDQEIWLDLEELAATANRKTYSSYTLRTTGEEATARLVEAVSENRRFPLSAQTARDFYRRTRGMASFMASLGKFIAFIVAIGAVFGGMNTMYAAVAARRREIAVLRALGFSRAAVLVGFLLESLALALVAGALGIALGTVIALLPVQLPFSAGGAVDLAPRQALSALLLAALIGLAGGGLPAIRATRAAIVERLG